MKKNYKITACSQKNEKLHIHQIDFTGKEISNSSDMHELYKEGTSLLKDIFPNDSLYDITLWKKGEFGPFLETYPQRVFDEDDNKNY